MKRLVILTMLLALFATTALATVVRPTSVPQQLKKKLAYDGSNNVEYVGKALSPCNSNEDCWQIAKLTYSGSNVTDVTWAGGTFAYVNIWDNRASYVYS